MFAVTIFLSAFLLFSLEPLVARHILPWFGGSAAVWSTCLVFYQTALLVGYLYARLLTQRFRPRTQTFIHLGVLAGSLLLLPIGPAEHWRPGSAQHPVWLIFAMMTSAIGLPFIALSATSPLLQAWLGRMNRPEPYRLFAISNFASLAALLSYPSLIEPQLGTRAQSISWSSLYVIFTLLCAAAAWRTMGVSRPIQDPEDTPQCAKAQLWRWFALAACGSMLLLSVTNHIDENVAAVPLLWVLPLAIYLLSFVLSFGVLNIYRRSFWLRLLAFALGMLAFAIYNINSRTPIQVSIPVFLTGLFLCCVFCHGELNELRPDASQLTTFYLCIAAGGAAGAISIGIVAPLFFSGVYELPITLLATALLALALTWNDRSWSLRVLWAIVSVCMLAVIMMNVEAYHLDTLSLRRSFYGSLRVVQTPRAGEDQQRILFHGTIEHGAQYVQPPRRGRPTTYYGPDSGVGILLRECYPSPKRVGVIGLGTGTLGAYGRAGDSFRFYEINPQIVDLAQGLFFYLRETAAHQSVVIGDGRLELEKDTTPPFDVLILDAFSGDAIPVHLLTREALALYKRHLAGNGTLAFHVSNDFLDLAPVVKQLARNSGLDCVLVHSAQDPDSAVLPADWVLATNNPAVLRNASVLTHARPIALRAATRLWTDDYDDILSAFKTPQITR